MMAHSYVVGASGGMDKGFRLVLCTCPDPDTAGRIAETLVQEALAACVNLIPGLTSIYRWEGRVQRDAEALLLIKTRVEHLPALSARIVALHPYALPEIVAVPLGEGSEGYLAWLAANLAPAP